MTYKTAANTEEAINVLKDEKILSMNTTLNLRKEFVKISYTSSIVAVVALNAKLKHVLFIKVVKILSSSKSWHLYSRNSKIIRICI
jgi:hypothetical protein